ncbi:MAG: Flp family type IVb pilin [Kiritimatiellia bacterium]
MNMKSKQSRKGQTMVEYIIIVALIAISLIAVFTYFGKATGKKVAGATQAIDNDMGDRAKQAVDSIEDPDDPKGIKELGNN